MLSKNLFSRLLRSIMGNGARWCNVMDEGHSCDYVTIFTVHNYPPPSITVQNHPKKAPPPTITRWHQKNNPSPTTTQNIQCTKMKFSVKDFFNKCDQICWKLDLVTFTKKILNGKLHFLCSDIHHLPPPARQKIHHLPPPPMTTQNVAI